MPTLTYPRDLILGVDPGLSGALVWFDPVKRVLIEVLQAPLVKLPNGKNTLNLQSLALTFHRMAPKTKFAVIEKVHSMPDQGVVSTFRFGQALGQIEGLIASHLIPAHLVPPESWKHVFQLSSDKAKSLSLARHLFPKQTAYFLRAKDDGLAEASLLAVYGALYFDKEEISL